MMRSVASVLLCVALFGGFALGQDEPIVGATCISTGPDNCVACCAEKFSNGVMNSDPSCATEQCSPFLNQATPAAPTADAPAADAPATEVPATEAPATEVPATEVPATEAPATEAPATEAPATEAPATEAPTTEAAPVPSPDAVIETPVDPNLPVEEALEDAAISPQILLSTAAAIILAVVA